MLALDPLFINIGQKIAKREQWNNSNMSKSRYMTRKQKTKTITPILPR